MGETERREFMLRYADEFCDRCERELKTYISFYDEFCHAHIEDIEKYAYIAMNYTNIGSPDFFYLIRQKISRFVFNIITLSSQNNENKYEPKPFQYIRDYNGRKKLIAKQSPPSIPKGSKRNTDDFKSYDRKLYNSISRAKQTIFELAECNDWEYFVTFTINKRLYERDNLEVFIKKFIKWLSNYSARKTGGRKIEYLLVPELGKKWAWHLHGFMSGLPLKDLSHFNAKKQPQLCRLGYLNWKAYENKFGHCAIGTPIRSKKDVAAYITKQFNKPWIAQDKRPLHSKLYYCTKGLKRSTELCRGYNLLAVDTYDYENEYVGITWLDE